MDVINKEMYHFHKDGIYDNFWNEGNTFEIDEDFESYYSSILKNFNTNVKTKDGYKTFEGIISSYLNEDQNKETLRSMLIDAERIISLANIFKREASLELVRQIKYYYLPSRRNSIWVTDRNSLNFWKKSLSTDSQGTGLSLYKVSLTGIMFMSSEYYIPSDDYHFEHCIRAAENYWDPDFSKIKNDRNEYLFQGKVKVLSLEKY